MIFWTKFSQKRYFPNKNRKYKDHHWILRTPISLGNKFQFKLTIIFSMKFAQKGYLGSKTEKMDTTIKLCIFKSELIPNFDWNWQFSFFGPNLAKKRLFPAENRKGEQHLSVLHIQISLGTKFQLKLTILIFWTSPLNYAYST